MIGRTPIAATLTAVLVTASCTSQKTPEQSAADATEALATRLVGSYSSSGQAAADPEFRDIRLEMVRIWSDRDDGPWLYIEQAAAGSLEQPYRQRIYRLQASSDPTRAEGTIESHVFELPGDPLLFAGAWRDPQRFAELRPIDLIARNGCTVYLEEASDGSWFGGTDGTNCASSLRGAAYATSEVDIVGDTMRTWDRGFDGDGKQVWGATKGPYEFVRLPSR